MGFGGVIKSQHQVLRNIVKSPTYPVDQLDKLCRSFVMIWLRLQKLFMGDFITVINSVLMDIQRWISGTN